MIKAILDTSVSAVGAEFGRVTAKKGRPMAVTPAEQARQVRAALRQIVDEHGPQALSVPSLMSNLLKDLLPDAPRIGRLLVAAAEDRVAEALRDHCSQGVDGAMAVRLAASSFAAATSSAPDACAWVVGELAIALDLVANDTAPPAIELGHARDAEPSPAVAYGRVEISSATELNASEQLLEPTRTADSTGQQVAAGQRREKQFLRAGTVSSDPVRMASLTGLPGLVTIALSPDGSLMAVNSGYTVTLWNVADLNKPIRSATYSHVPTAPRSGLVKHLVEAVEFSPDGRVLAAAAGRQVILWRLPGLGRSRTVDMSDVDDMLFSIDNVRLIAFSPDGDILAAAGRSVTFLDISRTGRLRTAKKVSAIIPGSFPTAVAFSPSKRILAVAEMRAATGWANPKAAEFKSGPVTLWDISDLANPVKVSEVGIQAVVKKLAFLSEDQILIMADRPVLSAWNISDLAYPPRLIARHDADPTKMLGEVVAFSPRRSLIATGWSQSDSVLLWEVTDPANPTSVPGPTGLYGSAPLALSSDGRRLATTGGVAGSLILWRL